MNDARKMGWTKIENFAEKENHPICVASRHERPIKARWILVFSGMTNEDEYLNGIHGYCTECLTQMALDLERMPLEDWDLMTGKNP